MIVVWEAIKSNTVDPYYVFMDNMDQPGIKDAEHLKIVGTFKGINDVSGLSVNKLYSSKKITDVTGGSINDVIEDLKARDELRDELPKNFDDIKTPDPLDQGPQKIDKIKATRPPVKQYGLDIRKILSAASNVEGNPEPDPDIGETPYFEVIKSRNELLDETLVRIGDMLDMIESLEDHIDKSDVYRLPSLKTQLETAKISYSHLSQSASIYKDVLDDCMSFLTGPGEAPIFVQKKYVSTGPKGGGKKIERIYNPKDMKIQARKVFHATVKSLSNQTAAMSNQIEKLNDIYDSLVSIYNRVVTSKDREHIEREESEMQKYRREYESYINEANGAPGAPADLIQILNFAQNGSYFANARGDYEAPKNADAAVRAVATWNQPVAMTPGMPRSIYVEDDYINRIYLNESDVRKHLDKRYGKQKFDIYTINAPLIIHDYTIWYNRFKTISEYARYMARRSKNQLRPFDVRPSSMNLKLATTYAWNEFTLKRDKSRFHIYTFIRCMLVGMPKKQCVQTANKTIGSAMKSSGNAKKVIPFLDAIKTRVQSVLVGKPRRANILVRLLEKLTNVPISNLRYGNEEFGLPPLRAMESVLNAGKELHTKNNLIIINEQIKRILGLNVSEGEIYDKYLSDCI